MQTQQVVSTTVREVGYDTERRVLRVIFSTGATYDYFGVSRDLYLQMLNPYPWRRVGRQVRAHRYQRM